MKSRKRLRILVLYWQPGGGVMRAAIASHLRALSAGDGGHDVIYHDVERPFPAWLCRKSLDAIILHNTFLCQRWSHLFWMRKWEWRWVADADCVKIAMPQDEYDHSEVLDEWLYELGVSTIFSNFPSAMHARLYPIMHERARFEHAFTGYVDEDAARRLAPDIRPIAERSVDVAYRASNLPYWFGSHGQLKHRIAALIGDPAKAAGLTCDVSTKLEDTIVGDRWFDFLSSSRAVLGCESGSSVLDRRGEIAWTIRRILQENSQATFEEVSAKLPAGWDDDRFFAVSPRHFEAVITGTCQVLIEGRYDGVLEAGRHYLSVRRDLSNLPEVFDALRDTDRIQKMVDVAYDEIYRSGRYTYRTLAGDLERAIRESETPSRSILSRAAAPALWKAVKIVRRTPRNVTPPVTKKILVSSSPRTAAKAPRKVSPPVVKVTRRSGGRSAALVLAMREVARVPEFRRWIKASWKRGRLRQSLRDLLMLRTLRLVNFEGYEPSCCIAATVDSEDGRLIFTTRPRSENPRQSPPLDWATLESTVRAQGLREIIWDHTLIGEDAPFLYWPMTLRRKVGKFGKASLPALSEFSREEPDAFLSVVRSLVAA
jgi:hypothetical protein